MVALEPRLHERPTEIEVSPTPITQVCCLRGIESVAFELT